MTGDDSLDFELLPAALRPLEPLIRRYDESDDVARQELLDDAPDEDLRELFQSAEPHWEAINAFLDAHMQPPGPGHDMALALQSLAQAAMEARLELDRRLRDADGTQAGA